MPHPRGTRRRRNSLEYAIGEHHRLHSMIAFQQRTPSCSLQVDVWTRTGERHTRQTELTGSPGHATGIEEVAAVSSLSVIMASYFCGRWEQRTEFQRRDRLDNRSVTSRLLARKTSACDKGDEQDHAELQGRNRAASSSGSTNWYTDVNPQALASARRFPSGCRCLFTNCWPLVGPHREGTKSLEVPR